MKDGSNKFFGFWQKPRNFHKFGKWRNIFACCKCSLLRRHFLIWSWACLFLWIPEFLEQFWPLELPFYDIPRNFYPQKFGWCNLPNSTWKYSSRHNFSRLLKYITKIIFKFRKTLILVFQNSNTHFITTFCTKIRTWKFTRFPLEKPTTVLIIIWV